MNRAAAVLSVATLLFAACTTPAPEPTTAPSSQPTVATVEPSTPAPVPTTAPATTTVPPLTVEGVPAEALALIGAPMPEVDLTMESPEDFERWFREYEKWNAWLGANPTQDSEILEYALVPDSPYYVGTRESQARVLTAGIVFVPERLPFLEVDKLEVASDLFDEGFLEAVVWIRNDAGSWSISVEDGMISERYDPSKEGSFVARVLKLEKGSDGFWRLADWEAP